jgi:fructokinase
MNDLELREIASIFGVSAARMDQEMEALLRKFSLRAVLVTRGERGAMAVSQHGMAQHPGFTVKVSDTIGAGDAFTAAATHCILAQMSLEKTLAVANWWASWVASQAGGMPAMTEKQRCEMRDVTAISA